MAGTAPGDRGIAGLSPYLADRWDTPPGSRRLGPRLAGRALTRRQIQRRHTGQRCGGPWTRPAVGGDGFTGLVCAVLAP